MRKMISMNLVRAAMLEHSHFHSCCHTIYVSGVGDQQSFEAQDTRPKVYCNGALIVCGSTIECFDSLCIFSSRPVVSRAIHGKAWGLVGYCDDGWGSPFAPTYHGVVSPLRKPAGTLRRFWAPTVV